MLKKPKYLTHLKLLIACKDLLQGDVCVAGALLVAVALLGLDADGGPYRLP